MKALPYIKAGPDDCWLWTRPLSPDGYGAKYSEKKHWSAHRWMYDQEIGPIPRGHAVVHRCKVKHCVNPKHLEVVPLSAVARRSPRTKLTIEIAREIRDRQQYERGEQQKVAQKYNISDSTVAKIWSGEIWAEH